MGLQFEGIDNLYVFLFIILIGQTWKYIEKNHMDYYCCPPYCAVDHEHDMELSGRPEDIRNVWHTCMHDDSIRILHMETDTVYTKRFDEFGDKEFSEAGRNNY